MSEGLTIVHKVNDLRHCETGPAVIYPNGRKEWYLDGKRITKREFDYRFGKNKFEKCYYKKNKLHREDGPAVISNHVQKWYLNGKLHRKDGPAVVIEKDRKEWWFNGKLHRTDGPAVIDFDGYKAWYKNGKLHREGGPALIYFEEVMTVKEWWLDGKLHRENGPAFEYSNGYKEYWINGKRLTKEKFNKRCKK